MDLKTLLRQPLRNSELTRPDWTNGAYRDRNHLWLDKNENLDPELLAFTKSILNSLDADAICTYPECAPLYKKLSEHLDVATHRLLLTAGSDGAIRMVFEAFVNEGDVVLHTGPTFAMYSVYSKMYGAKEITWDYSASEQGPELKFQGFLQCIRSNRPKLVCIPNPDSPTGTVLTPEQMETLIQTTRDSNSILLIDEAYFPFYPETVIQNSASHLIVARTFAKAWGLAGFRIGFLAASAEIAPYLHKVRPMYEVNTLSVVMMEKMLEHSDVVMGSVARLTEGKNLFLSEMSKAGYKVLRGHGNFSHVAFGSDQKLVIEALKNKVLFRPDFREVCLQGYSRFSSTTPELFRPVINLIRSAKENQCLNL